MASLWRSFVPGERLLSSHINSALNPATADHIAYSTFTAFGTVPGVAINGGEQNITVPLPPGRFTVAPAAIVQFRTSNTAGAKSIFAVVTDVTTSSVSLRFVNTHATLVSGGYYNLLCIQQLATGNG